MQLNFRVPKAVSDDARVLTSDPALRPKPQLPHMVMFASQQECGEHTAFLGFTSLP